MVSPVFTFSPLELCYRGDYKAAAETLGLRVGEWPENGSEGNSGYARRLLVAGIITSTLGGIQQTVDQSVGRAMLLKSIELCPELSVEARAWLAWSYYWTAEYREALMIADLVLVEPMDSRLRFRTLLLKLIGLTHLDETQEALAVLQKMEALYDVQDDLLKGKFHLQRGRLLQLTSETDRAIVEYDCAIHFFQERGDGRCEAAAATHLARLYSDSQRLIEAETYALRAQKLFEHLGDKSYEAKAWDELALIRLKGGQVELAKDAITQALKLISQKGQVLNECIDTSEKIKQIPKVVEPDHGKLAAIVAPTFSPTREERREPDMAPLDYAVQILQDPENAAALYYLIAWAANSRGDLQRDAERDHLEAACWIKTPEAERLRQEYRESLFPAISDS